MISPLWSETNLTTFSSIFTVPSGNVCILFADKLEPYKYRTTAQEVRVPQAVCVRRILLDFDASSKKTNLPCGYIFDISELKVNKIVDQLIRTCGYPWQLTSCRNMGIIGVPGTYRLELNDSTAVGVAQVYAEFFAAKDFPTQVSSLFYS